MTFNIINNPYHIYFITAKIEGGKHLFINKEFINIIVDCLEFLTDKERIKLFAFVIMPNHIHLLLKPLGKWLATRICSDFEKYTAHQILKVLKEKHSRSLLEFFNSQAENFTDRSHKIWKDIQAQNCYSEEFLNQKLNYIHNNPVAKGWNLVKDRKDYPYSSACYYDSDLKTKPIIEVDYLWNYFFWGDRK